VNEQGDDRTGTFSKWITRARQYQEKLERRPWMAFPLESIRRFNKIDGKHLALVIAINLFAAVIPLIFISYALIEAFNPDHDVGNLIAGNLQADTRSPLRADAPRTWCAVAGGLSPR